MGNCLNLGCGKKYINGHVNVDVTKELKVDICCDARFLPFRDNVFNEVRCIHVLEHVSPFWLVQTVKEIYRVLTENGIVYCNTPDMYYIFYLIQMDSTLGKLYGKAYQGTFGADRWGNYDIHKSFFLPETLKELFSLCGFKIKSLKRRGQLMLVAVK